MIKLDFLRTFVTVARYGNLRDASDELGRTQAALSMTLAQLEELLDGPLFETDRKKDLTDLGLFVRDLGDELVREHDRVQELIFGYAKGSTGHLRIASVPSVAALILPDLLRGFMHQHKGAQIDLMDSDSTNVRTLIETGHADLGIAGPAPAGQSLQGNILFNDTLHVVCHEDSKIAGMSGPLRWQELKDEVLISNETLSVVTSQAAKDILSRSRLSVRNIMSLFAMIESGTGLTVLPGLATRSLKAPLVAIPMAGESCTRKISLLSRSGRTDSPLSASFQKFFIQRLPGIKSEFGLA